MSVITTACSFSIMSNKDLANCDHYFVSMLESNAVFASFSSN